MLTRVKAVFRIFRVPREVLSPKWGNTIGFSFRVVLSGIKN